MTEERLKEIRKIWPTPTSGNGSEMVWELLYEVAALMEMDKALDDAEMEIVKLPGRYHVQFIGGEMEDGRHQITKGNGATLTTAIQSAIDGLP